MTLVNPRTKPQAGRPVASDCCPPGLVGLWLATEGYGLNASASAGTRPVPATFTSSRWAPGVFGPRINIAGNTANRGMADLSGPGAVGSAFTVMAMGTPASAGVVQVALSRQGASASDRHFQLRINASNAAEFIRWDSTGGNVIVASTAATTTANKLCVLAGTTIGNTVIAYINGIAGNPATLSGSGSSWNGMLDIGDIPASSAPWTGSLECWAVFGRALSAAEVGWLSEKWRRGDFGALTWTGLHTFGFSASPGFLQTLAMRSQVLGVGVY